MTKEIIINDSEYAQILQQAVSEIQTARATIGISGSYSLIET